MKTFTMFLALAVAGGACKKAEDKKPTPEAPKTADATGADKEAADKAAKEAEAKRLEAEKAAKRLAEEEAEIAELKKRWTPELEKQAAALVAKTFPNTKAALTAIVASDHRVPANRPRDAHRHPVETLTFFGIDPKMTVIELGAGEGWYTEIIAPLLAREGKFVAVSFDPDGPADSMRTVYGKRLAMFLALSPATFGKVQAVAIDPPTKMDLGPPGSADLVLALREMHNWQRRDQVDAYLAAVHAVLKPGGSFGVEQHRAAAGSDVAKTAEKGYLPEEWVIQRVTAAGFELAEKSEINANPKDPKDHEKGVWMLPPNLRDVPEADKAKFAAIGESDRMTLRFVKKK